MHYDPLEIAKIIGSPVDPRRPYPLLVETICETETALPSEYHYYYDVLQDTDKIYVITGGTAVTQLNVTPDTPTALTFVDVASPELYVKLTDLASAKELVLARKKKTISRSLNAEENYRIIAAVDAACISLGNLRDLDSAQTRFRYNNLIDMIDLIIDYSENYVLVMGTLIDKDVKLWNWNDNKYHDLTEAFNDLGITKIRINQTVTRDGSSTSVLSSTIAYLAGTQTEEPGKPVLFVRKQLSAIEKLGSSFEAVGGDVPERLVYISPNPIQVSTDRYLAVGMTGFEEIVVAVTNPYALAKFTRTA